MGKIIQFFREVWVELGKVVWPSRQEALKITGIVVFFSLLVAAFLGAVDLGLARLLGLLIK
jgi:preprotein translocase subunit SecE